MARANTQPDSEMIKIVVERKYPTGDDNEDKLKIFSSSMVVINGKSILKRYFIPAGVEVELPEPIVTQLRGRKIPKEKYGKLNMVPEFDITVIQD